MSGKGGYFQYLTCRQGTLRKEANHLDFLHKYGSRVEGNFPPQGKRLKLNMMKIWGVGMRGPALSANELRLTCLSPDLKLHEGFTDNWRHPLCLKLTVLMGFIALLRDALDDTVMCIAKMPKSAKECQRAPKSAKERQRVPKSATPATKCGLCLETVSTFLFSLVREKVQF